jgi:putative transposase
MANTYTQIHIHIVFAVKARTNRIPMESTDRISKYITGIVHEKGQKMITIKCMPDHLHLLIGQRPNIALSDLVRDVKSCSTAFIKKEHLASPTFSWQEGFGAFSYAKSDIPVVARYIEKQEEHHQKRSFREEYLDILTKFEVDYDPQYVFEWYD